MSERTTEALDRGVIAIDGPAASGKSTVARALAKKLDWLYVDSGALYRAVAWKAIGEGIDCGDAEAVARLVAAWRLFFGVFDGAVRVVADGKTLDAELRTPEVNAGVSPVATVPRVRDAVVADLRAMRQLGRLVMEGRDIGTKVFPSAGVRVYLTASAEVRAQRRHCEFRGGAVAPHASKEDVARNLSERDRIDRSRKIDPLRVADGALEIDSTLLTVEQIVERILDEARRNGMDGIE